MKKALGIILYHPTADDLQKLVMYQKIFDRVIVYDNSEDNSSYENVLKELLNLNISIYLYTASNDGICKAINKMIYVCSQENIEFLCTMDQDSIFREEDIRKMLDFVNYNVMDNVGILSPNIVYSHVDKKSIIKNGISDVNWVITSGSFINISEINKKNIRYDENYFIDRCDLDFCDQVRSAELKIIRINNAFMYQSLGEVNEKKFSEHGYLRHYYIFRNRFYYAKKNKGMIKAIVQTVRHVWLIAIHEHDKKRKLKQLFYAITDYKKGKMGKRQI